MMKNTKRIINSIILLVLLLTCLSEAQQKDKFLIGAYMHSTPFGFADNYQTHDSSAFSLWRAKALGINTAIVYVRLADMDDNIGFIGQKKLSANMKALRYFPNIIAMNTFASYKLIDGLPPGEVPNRYIRNFDYIYFYSGAYYSKWDAALESLPVSTLGLKHDHGFRKYSGDKIYWSTHNAGKPPLKNQITDKWFVKGPNYLQETRYRGSRYPTIWHNDLQTYEVNFNLKLGKAPQTGQSNDLVCRIMVYVKYFMNNKIFHEPLVSKELTAGEIWRNPDVHKLRYNYSGFNQNTYKLADVNIRKDLIDVEFRVEYLNPVHELLIDYIEVYDINIWHKMLSDEKKKSQARQNIVNYLNKFKACDIQFYTNNLKYFFGVDEPHSVDCYIPHAFVQGVLDSLNKAWKEGAPLLFTHFYPGWNGFRNDARTITPFFNTVKPQPFHFYYAPFSFDPDVPPEQGLENLRNIFYWVYDGIKRSDGLMDDFYITLEVWDQGPDHWLKWRSPFPAELNAAVMMSLAHGAKGILYEPFYSYGDGKGTVNGLLEREYPYNPKPIGVHLRDKLHPRLNGILGSTLMKLKYAGKEICLRSGLNSDVTCTYAGSSDNYLTLYGSTKSKNYDFNATFLIDTLDPDNKFFMIVNSLINESKIAGAGLNFINSAYTNIRVKNVEGGIDTTFNSGNVFITDLNFSAGEGYLFQAAPVIKYGGNLLYNETVSGIQTLHNPLIIKSDAKLIVDNGAFYTIMADIIVEPRAKIEIKSGGRLKFLNNARIIKR